MTQSYDDNRYYCEWQDFGPVNVSNYASVLRTYSYERYVREFRALADHRRLKPGQRPKLSTVEYGRFLERLRDTVRQGGEEKLLQSEKSRSIADRLLLLGLFDVDRD